MGGLVDHVKKTQLHSGGGEKHSVLTFGVKWSLLCFGMCVLLLAPRSSYWREWKQNLRYKDQGEE